MNKEEDYSSDSDDEDFCPEKAGAVAQASEDESDEEAEEEEDGHEEATSNKKPMKGRKKVLTKKSKKAKKQSDDSNDDEEEDEVNEGSRRSTRQTEEANSEREKSKHDKDELESDDNEKSRTDALWADFLGDVKQPAKKSSNTSTVNTASSSKAAAVSAPSPVEVKTATPVVEKPKQITVTEIVDFAGEEVRVEKTVSAESIKENKVTPVAGISGRAGFPAGLKRPSAGGSAGGLGSLLNQLGKKKKLSVLEKTKLDWSSFKQDEGIDEQLQTFNKGKDGYLERQDFLQRTDLRQFEIEKNLRQTTRRNNN